MLFIYLFICLFYYTFLKSTLGSVPVGCRICHLQRHMCMSIIQIQIQIQLQIQDIRAMQRRTSIKLITQMYNDDS
jgi:hypothetical protein